MFLFKKDVYSDGLRCFTFQPNIPYNAQLLQVLRLGNKTSIDDRREQESEKGE